MRLRVVSGKQSKCNSVLVERHPEENYDKEYQTECDKAFLFLDPRHLFNFNTTCSSGCGLLGSSNIARCKVFFSKRIDQHGNKH